MVIFPNRVVHGFGEKSLVKTFSCFYFGQNRPEEGVLRYSRKRKRLFRL